MFGTLQFSICPVPIARLVTFVDYLLRRCSLSLGRSRRTRTPALSVFFSHLFIHRRRHRYPPGCLTTPPHLHISLTSVSIAVFHDSASARILPSSVQKRKRQPSPPHRAASGCPPLPLHRNQRDNHLFAGDSQYYHSTSHRQISPASH